MSNDDAVIKMVNANLQRPRITFSEKGFSYKMKNDAMKRKAGHQRSLVDPNLKGKKTVQLIGKEFGDSPKQVQRFISITKLIPELLKKLDEINP